MTIFIREWLRHVNNNTLLSLQIGRYRECLQINDHRTWQDSFKGFELDTPKILEAGFGKIRGLKPQIVETMAVPSCIDDEVGPVTASNVRTRGANPPMANGVCPFSESDDPRYASDSTISSMTTEEGGVGAI